MLTITVLTVSGSREHVTGWAVPLDWGDPLSVADFPPVLLAIS